MIRRKLVCQSIFEYLLYNINALIKLFGVAGIHGILAPETVPPTTLPGAESVSNQMESVDQPQRIINLVKNWDVTVSIVFYLFRIFWILFLFLIL